MALSNPDKSHPSYADGYYAAFRQATFDTDRADDEQYAFGFAAGERAAQILQSGGLVFDGEGYSMRLPVEPAAPRERSNHAGRE